MDGFDHYPTADLALKGWVKYDGYGGASISTTRKKTGPQSLFSTQGGGGSYRLRKMLPATKNVLVVGFWIYLDSGYTGNFLWLMDGSNTQIKLGVLSNGRLRVYRDGTTLATSAVGALLTPGNSIHVQIKVVFSQTVGTVEVKINDATVISLVDQDTCSSANEYCDSILLGNQDGIASCYFDNFWMDDLNFNGDLAIETLYPNGAGATTGWSPSAGSNYACVDELTENGDTDYVYSATPDAVDTYTYGNLPELTGTVKAVQVNMYAKMDENGANKIAPVVRPSTVDRVGDTKSVNSIYEHFSQLYTTNPDDASAWTIASVNGSEFGIKVIE